MSYLLNLNRREQGTIWNIKDFNNIKGRVLSVSNSGPKEDGEGSRLVQAAMDRFSSVLVTGDNLGHVYLLHLERNKFELLCSLGSCVTALSLSPGGVLVATASSSTFCFDSVSGAQRAVVKSPDSAITAISVHSSGCTALLSSLDQAMIWSLEDFSIVHRLTLACRVDILRVFYQPVLNNIATAFVDGSIFLWDSDSMACVHHKAVGHSIRAVDISRDGRLVATGTRHGLLEIYEPDSHREGVTLTVEPASIRQLAFLPFDTSLPEYNLVAVLAFSGAVSIHHTLSPNRPLLRLPAARRGKYVRMATPGSGAHLLLLGSNGDLDIFDLGLIWADKNEVPKPKKVSVKVAPKSTRSTKLKPPEMNLAKIKMVVREFGEFPDKYRLLCWSRLLQLPNNAAAFEVLASRVRHLPLDQALDDRYPVADLAVRKPFHRVVRLFILWCPLLETVRYLPSLVFPFVKLFPRSIMEVFEILLTYFTSWCQNWLVFHPAPPAHLLTLAENLLGHHDGLLLAHFSSCTISSQTYAWSLLQTGFSEVLSRDHWAALWDNIFCQEPSFLIHLVLAFNLLSRNTLLRCITIEEFEAYFSQQSNLSALQVVRKACELRADTPAYLSPDLIVGGFTPLPSDTYPLFTNFPRFGVDLDEERERLTQQELDYLQRRQTTLALEDAERRFHTQRNPSSGHSALTHPDNLRFQEERRSRSQMELRKLEKMKRNLLDHMQWSGARRKEGRRYDDVVMKNAQLLLQKNLLEQELYRAVLASGQPHPLRTSVPLVVRHQQHCTPRDTLAAENNNLIQQISEMQAHLRSIKGRCKDASTAATPQPSYDCQYLDALNNALVVRQALVQRHGARPYTC